VQTANYNIELEGIDRLLGSYRALVPQEKKRIVWSMMIRRALQLNRARIKAQENLDGSKFAERKNGGKTKMLRGLLREGKKPQIRKRNLETGGILETTNPIAARHHFGFAQIVQAWTREEALAYIKNDKKKNLIHGQGGDKSPCTKLQARTLISDLGFKQLVLDGKKVKASIKNLQRAFTQSQAGMLIKKDRVLNKKPLRTRWEVKVAARHVLGLGETDKTLLTAYFAELIAKFSRLEMHRENVARTSAMLLNAA